MINRFSQYLVEEQKTVFFTFGRMNPPTIGHEKLLSALAKASKGNPYRVYLSQSSDAKKNPLPYPAKVKYARKMFPKHARQIMMDKKPKNALEVASKLYDEGFKNVAMVVGSDRVNEFEALLKKYNGTKGRHGFYNFQNINVISAGERDPDAEGVTGMSASKMRKAAGEDDFPMFAQGLPKSISNSDAKKIYNDVRKGMGLKEQKEFKNHVKLEPVSDLRESYLRDNLFEVGEEVVMPKNNGIVGKIKHLGTNYIIVESKGETWRCWLNDVSKVNPTEEIEYDTVGEAKQDPDIKDRPGAQPAGYHKGLKKSTKIARDRQFKKQAKMSDDDPAAYKPAPGDATAKTKLSKHTKKFRQMFGDD